MLNHKIQFPILNSIKSDFKKDPIHIYTQILTTNFLLLILAIILFVFILVTLAVQTINEQTSNLNYDNLYYINNETEDFFENLKEDLRYITSNQEIRSSLVFSNQFEYVDEFNITSSTKNYINYLLGKEGYELKFANLNQLLTIYSNSSIDPTYDLKSESWYREFMEQDITEKIVSHSKQNDNLDNKNVMSYILAIRNYTEDKTIGFFILEISNKIIQELYTEKISPIYPIIILDENNELIFHSEGITKEMLDKIIEENKYFVKEENIRIGNEKYLVSKWQSGITNWRILSIISTDKQLGPFTQLAFILAPIIVLIIIIHTLISNNTSKNIIKPINDLISTMKKTREGYFNQIPLAKTNIYEIDELSSTFNSMMKEINSLIDTNQKINLLKVESQLIALQQKINPHFLFNTLELISGQAILEDANATSEMAQKLGNLFRYNLRAPDILPIKNETDYFKDYVYLQQVRFNNTLNVEIDIQDELLDYKIPKLTLQPLFENSIKHGFDGLPCDDNVFIIKGYRRKSDMIIEAIDNGAGIPDEKLESINKALIDDHNNFQHFIDRKEHIGIRNVNARLCLYYKISIGLKVESETNKGTKITLMLPIKDIK